MEERLGRYRLQGELGRGGMGRVLLALDPEIGREVAIKILREEVGADRATLQRFVAEARITGQLEHPNIVPVYDAGVAEDGRLYYVMKRVAGASLDALLRAPPPDWGLHRLLGAFQAVCDAVSFAHSRGVLHQDLKPQNIILGDFGEVLVLDWGLATLLRAGLRVSHAPPLGGELGGTPGYIAPELLAGRGALPTPRSDQWSLGAVLYTMLSGQPPYEGSTTGELLAATLRGPPEDVRLRDPAAEVPHELGEICHRALSADPDVRFPDVAALSAAVRAVQEGRERRGRALLLVAEADALAPRITALRAEAAARGRAAAARLDGVKGADPVERKRAAWALQDEAEAALREATLEQVVWEQRLQGALQLVPDLHEAHLRLARHHREALEAAEAAHEVGAAARAEWMLRQHDRGHHRRWLAGTASLSLHTEPAGAPVRLRPLSLVDRQLQPGPARELGRTPLLDLTLSPGSYLLEVEAEGRAPVRYPVSLPRAGRWDGLPPGASAPLPIYLPRADELGPDDVYVPAGWFLAGGDAEAPDALTARRVWVDGFVCRRFPLSQGELLHHLNALLAADRVEEALRIVPREPQRPAHPLEGAPTFYRLPDGRFGPPPEVDPLRWLRLPVRNIDLGGALLLFEGLGWRLPNELEREKAARGVDGRRYPWGDFADPAFSCIVQSQTLPEPVPVDAFPLDESVYGIRGLAGNVRDLCGNRWMEEGPAGDGERLVHRPAGPEVDFISARGGAWSSTLGLARSAARFGDPPSARPSLRGARLFRSLG